MIELRPIYDGDSGPTYRFQTKDDGTIVPGSIVAVEFYVCDTSSQVLARRAGLPTTPKSDGYQDLIMLGKETDFDGLGADLIVKPKLYCLVAPDGTAGVNLLANPSFDTDGNADGVADSWTIQGSKTATWAILSDDPFPPAIFGSTQKVKHASGADPDYFQQTGAASIANGDVYSFGVWHRSDGSGGSQADTHAVFARFGANPNTYTRFRVGTNDWYFSIGSIMAFQVESAWTMGVDLRNTTLDNRLDDAFFGKGSWRTVPAAPYRLQVLPRRRVSKNQNQIQGVGSFEVDSNADGCADGWSKANCPGATFAMEYTPANVFHGLASQKITLAALTGQFLRHIRRGKYAAGETWRASVRLKTNGALTGSPSAGQWAIQVSTDNFEDLAPQQSSVATNFGTNVGSFTLYQSDIVIANTVSALRVDLFLNGVTGSAWVDDVHLERVTP